MWRKNPWYLGIIFVILLSSCVYAISINEIMYDPDGSDNNNEYVEIYFESYINLSNYIIQDYKKSDTLKEVKFIDGKYALIVGTKFNYNNTNFTIYICNDTQIGNNLNNEEDMIVIKDSNNTIIDVLHYYNQWGADGNGKSLCKLNNIWQECISTPGYENIKENISVYQYYTKLKINELFPDPQGYDNAAMPEGEWIELYNSGDDIDLGGFYFKDDTNHKLIISDTRTLEGTVIKSNDYLVIYVNGYSGLLKNEGLEELEFYDKDDFLLDEVSYSGSVEGLTWGKIDNLWKLTLPTPSEDNFYNETINESSLEIENLYDDTFKFGEIIRAKVHVYKGDTDRYSIQAWVEDEDDNEISKRSRVSIYNKFIDYDLIIPIQVFSNCVEKYEEGEYDVIVEGLGLRDKEEIKLVSNVKDMCRVETIEKEVVKEVSTSTAGLIEKDINTTYSLEYTSKEVKERRLAIYFFCIILIVMLLYFGLNKNG